MERATYTKFIFIFVIALLTLVISFYSFFGNGDDENVEDMFNTNDDGDDEAFSIDDYIDDDSQDENIELDEELDEDLEEGEAESDDNESDQDNHSHDFEEEIVDKFGEERTARAKEIAEETMTLWLQDETDIDVWEALVTEEYLEILQDELVTSDDSVNREIDTMQLYTVQSNNEDEILFEVEVEWYINQNDQLVDKQGKLFYITV